MLFYLLQKNTSMIKIGKSASHISIYTCQSQSKSELKDIIEKRIKSEGSNCDLNDIDTSLIEDMSFLFYGPNFNGDIGNWNVSNVENMLWMFYRSVFSGDISNWNVSKVRDTRYMFYRSPFNQDISSWKINKDCDTDDMFLYCDIKEEFKPKSLQKR